MRTLLAVVAAIAVLAAPACAQTTTTTGIPATTTTIPGTGCADRPDPTLCRINSRLEALRDTVAYAWTRGGIGRPLDPIVFRLQRCSECLTRARGLCHWRSRTDENRARRKLRQCVRPLAAVLAKLRSNRMRRILPPDLAATIAFEADGIANDLEVARESLACPTSPKASLGAARMARP